MFEFYVVRSEMNLVYVFLWLLFVDLLFFCSAEHPKAEVIYIFQSYTNKTWVLPVACLPFEVLGYPCSEQAEETPTRRYIVPEKCA